ncbi:MAG: hypothetical protein E6164_06705 [Dialister sp.]|nr:hypothetical protein [Dialister sp.]
MSAYLKAQTGRNCGRSQREPLLWWKSGRRDTVSHPRAVSENCPLRTLRVNEWSLDYVGGTAEVSFVLYG